MVHQMESQQTGLQNESKCCSLSAESVNGQLLDNTFAIMIGQMLLFYIAPASNPDSKTPKSRKI